MNDKYISEGFEGNLPTQPGVKTTELRIVYLPKGVLMLLIVLLVFVFSHVCSRTYAEEHAMMSAEIDRTDQTVQEMGIAKMSEDQTRRKIILVLHALKVKRPWNVLFNRYFTESLKEINLSLENIEIESLDLLQFKDANYQEIVKKQLEHKYANLKPDIIVATFASTINFILENDMFPDIPKILILPTPSDFEEIPNSVILPFAHEFKENIEHALTLLPDTKSIYVVAGNGLMDRRLVSMFQNDTKNFENRVSFHYLDDLNVEALLSRLEQLPDDSFVYYLTYSLDFHGTSVITRDFSKRIGKKSNRPVFSWLDLHALGIGILGGRVTTTRASATMSVDIVKRVFEGETIDSIKPEPPYVEYIYEWKELKKWDIDLSKLPPDSLIQNRPYNFYESYKWQIVGVILLLIVESFLVLFLLINIRKRKTAEHRLRVNQVELETEIIEHQRAENKYHTFVKKSGEGIWAYDLEPPLPMDLPVEDQLDLLYERAYMTEANDTLARMLGFEKGEELLGMRLDDFQPRTNPDNVAYVKNVVREKFNVTDFELSAFGAAGEIRILLNNILGIVEDGKLLRVWGTSRDITDGKVAEEKLRQTEQRYQTVADYTYDWEYWERPEGSLEYVSPSCERITGYTVEEFVNDPSLIKDIILPEYRKVWDGYKEDIHAGKQFQGIELKIRTKVGSITWIEHAGLLVIDDKGNNLGYRASVREIIDRKNLEKALSQSRLLLQSIMDYAPMLISAKDLEGNLIMVNKKFEVLDGPSPEEFIGKNVFDLFPKEIAEELWRNDRLVVKTDRPVEAEEKVYHKDGTLHQYNTIKFPLYDNDGKAFAVCAISPDITERKLAETDLKKKEVELQKSHKELQSLAGKLLTAQEEERRLLARELHDDLTQRLALMAIEIGKLEMQSKSLSTSFPQDIGKIREDIIDISEDVHDISRQLHPSILDDLGLVDALKSECAIFSQHEGLSVKYATQNVNRKIPRDITLCIYRIAQHSLKNIAKHAKATEVSVSVTCDDITLCLKVEDNGIGFIPNQINGKGGLGLVSMKERARLIQGNLSIQSKPGIGTVIKVKASLQRENV